MKRHHIIITGTGRAGTTFLVQLFTAMGLDTGFYSKFDKYYENCNAGLESDLRNPDSPYIVKSPWICNYLEDLLNEGNIAIDHAIIPFRDLFSAAESRRFVSSKIETPSSSINVPGGVWDTQDPQNQEEILTAKIYKLLHALVRFDIPITFIYFPEFIHNPEYLFNKLYFLFENISYQNFLNVFKNISQPDLIHAFHPNPLVFEESKNKSSDYKLNEMEKSISKIRELIDDQNKIIQLMQTSLKKLV